LLGNITQTDTVGLSLSMRTAQAQNNASFTCSSNTTGGGGGGFTPGPCKHPTHTGVHYDSYDHRKGDDKHEVDLGSDVDSKGHRKEQGHTWAYGASNPFTFTFDKAHNTFTSTLGGDATLSYKNASAGASCPVSHWNVLEIHQEGEHAGAVSVRNIHVNGKQYGNLVGTHAQDSWTLSGLNLSQGFTVTGELLLSGKPSKNGNGNHLSIVVGCDTP
jgi:hypothetical protein